MSSPLRAAAAVVPRPGFAAAGNGSTGWLYDLLRKAGVSPPTAHTVVEFVFRPLEIALVVAVAAVVAHFGAKAIRRWLGHLGRRAVSRSSSPRAAGRATTVSALVANLWRFAVGVVAASTILGIFGINLTPLLASATVIGATIGFGAQALVRDYLSGALLTIEDQFGIGDTITVNGTTGVVEDLSLRVTRVRAIDGTVWYVPNGEIRRLGNASRGWAKALVDIPVAPAPGSSLDAVRNTVLVAATAVASQPRFAPVCPEPPEVMGVVGADAATYTLRVTLRTQPAERDRLERAMRGAIVDALSAARLWPPAAPPGPADPATAGDAAPT
jgi:small conductance mechanosensitive channel